MWLCAGGGTLVVNAACDFANHRGTVALHREKIVKTVGVG